jgi:hypothetical protein
MPKPVLPAKRRRKGFESVRKGYRSADARLLFFENGLLYCKLTVASGIRKGLLLVSFVAVGSRCRCELKNTFLYRVALHELKKQPFSANQKVFLLQKALRTVLKNRLLCAKNLLFAQTFLIPTQNNSFLPSTSHSHHP